MNREFLSCDWGTTSFRLRRVAGPDCTVIREIREPSGVKSLYEEAMRSGAEIEAGRAKVFAGFLHRKCEALLAGQKTPERELPLVISGMASSSVGWRELPYAKTPFPLDGCGLRSQEVNWSKPEWVGPAHLISGVATTCDMMRGEETEIIGLMSDASLAPLRERSLLILPGTHSKHVWIEDQSVVEFRTFMKHAIVIDVGKSDDLEAILKHPNYCRNRKDSVRIKLYSLATYRHRKIQYSTVLQQFVQACQSFHMALSVNSVRVAAKSKMLQRVQAGERVTISLIFGRHTGQIALAEDDIACSR